ncbi:SDR family oxidoreductase [Mucilaginibacter sp. E4BP6]|uniref:SDR family oxidoreductase n=1 Tax=Mucilaginibacter sp. E4BP6 TaxID=2723089 RepID=UPI0015C8959B|nr:SDR family oxidoreductase [Mucilaginibacter sp. E4BP6]NYE64941.1 NAD(P)-dependent dehydrogenase (short-subunit alcohol dehydrogenase family) [Mucilaginibacter sp. E4BP6]
MKKIIVTGSGSGFGLLTVKTLAKQGHTVYATMRNTNSRNEDNAKSIKQWAEENNADVRIVELDVTSDTSVNSAIKKIAEDAEGTIDVLINNAGLFIMGLSESLSNKQVDQLFQVNVLGADRMIKAVLPYMHAQKSGLLIQISSGLSRLHLPYLGAYTAAKVAIDALAEIYHYELLKSGIESIVVQPGAYPTTDIFSNQLLPENEAAVKGYGEYGEKIKQGIGYLFAATPESPDPQDVADLLAEIVNTPRGERKQWTAIGIGAGQPAVDGINESIGEFSKSVQNALGII